VWWRSRSAPGRRAAPALTDLLAGQVQIYFSTTPSSIEYIRTGKLRGLAVTTAERLELLPDLPTIGEFVRSYEASAWYGVVAPKQTPRAVVDTLNRELGAVLADGSLKAKFENLGCVPIGGSSEEFARLIVDETEKWGKVVKFAGLRAS